MTTTRSLPTSQLPNALVLGLEDIHYHLYVLQRIARGRADIETGSVIPQDEVERRMARWLEM